MNQTINITVVVQRPETEGERFRRQSEGWAKALGQMYNRITEVQKAKGNPFFQNVTSFEEYQQAWIKCKAAERKRLGFWKYHFGDREFL